MSQQQHILVVDDMVTSTKMMTVMLRRANYQVTAFNKPMEALEWLKVPANHPDLIVTDLNMPDVDGIQLVQYTRKMEGLATIPILILSAETDKNRVLASLKAGANDYMLKPVRGPDLVQRVEKLLSSVSADAPGQSAGQSVAVAVFSFRGGVGTTSVAVNLAMAFRQLWGKETVLFDLSSQNAHAALWLGLKAEKTLANFTASNPPNLSDADVNSLLLAHDSGLKVLPAPAFAYDSAKITDALVAQAWAHLKKMFSFVVVDAGSSVTPAAYAAMTRCKKTILLIAPEKGSVVAAKNAISLATQLKYDASNILPVVNKLVAEGGLSDKAVASAVGREIETVIPHDAVGFVEAINSGTPFIESNPMAEASMAIAKLAYKLSPDGLKLDVPEDASVLLKEVQKQMA